MTFLNLIILYHKTSTALTPGLYPGFYRYISKSLIFVTNALAYTAAIA